MPSFSRGFDQWYNAQAFFLAMGTFLIEENHVSQSSNDKHEIEAAIEGLGRLHKEIGKIETMVADGGRRAYLI